MRISKLLSLNGSFNVFVAGESVKFNVIKIDAKNNLALIKIDRNNLSTIGFADANRIKLGQKVFLVASTSIKQDNWLANEGIISQINKESIQTNISESINVVGSPLFNTVGELIGISFIDQEGKLSAIPTDKIRTLMGL